MNYTKYWKCLIDSINDAIKHDGIEHAGYLAYLLMLTLCPFLVFFVALVSFIGQKELGIILMDLILQSDWGSFIESIKPQMIEIIKGPPQSLLTFAIVSAVWTASSIFEAIRTILNKVYHLNDIPHYLRRRLSSILEFVASITMTVTVTFLLLFVPNIVSFLERTVFDKIIPGFFLHGFYWIRISITIISCFAILCGIFYFLPNRKQNIRNIWSGALFVLLSWLICTKVFAYYVKMAPSISVIYGSITGIIITQLYFYVCSFVFIVGAELNYNLEKYIKKINIKTSHEKY